MSVCNSSTCKLDLMYEVRLQELGWYDPLKKDTNLNAPAIKKWLAVGAKPSDTVEVLLRKAMVID